MTLFLNLVCGGFSIGLGIGLAYVLIIALGTLIGLRAVARKVESIEPEPVEEDGDMIDVEFTIRLSPEESEGRTAATESLRIGEPVEDGCPGPERFVALQVPTPGRMVMTTSVSGKLWPAIIAYVHKPGHPESEVDLFVFSTDNGGYISKYVAQGNGCTEWRWPAYAKPVMVPV